MEPRRVRDTTRSPYQFPSTRGLTDAAGIYNVTQFRINKDTLAYSKTDPVRWQDVVFEKWATLKHPFQSSRDPGFDERGKAHGFRKMSAFMNWRVPREDIITALRRIR